MLLWRKKKKTTSQDINEKRGSYQGKNEKNPSRNLSTNIGVSEMKRRQRGYMQKPRSQNVRV